MTSVWVGQGTLDQIHGNFEDLAALGAENVLLDTYGGKPVATGHSENDWAMLELLTERVFDLERQTVR
jgi:hypothetical protein